MISEINNLPFNLEKLRETLGLLLQAEKPHVYWTFIFEKLATTVDKKAAENEFQYPELVRRLINLNIESFLKTLENLDAGTEISEAWKISVKAAKRKNISFFQHLAIDTSAEVNFSLIKNLTLGFSEDELKLLENDFEKISSFVNNLVSQTTKWVEEIWASGVEEKISSFPYLPGPVYIPRLVKEGWFSAMDSALLNYRRKTAIHEARKIQKLTETEQENAFLLLDRQTAKINRQVISPPVPFALGITFIHSLEPATASEILNAFPESE